MDNRVASNPAFGLVSAQWPLWLGMTLIVAPTVHRLATMKWSSALGAFHGIVLCLAALLVAREWPGMKASGKPGSQPLAFTMLVLVMAGYAVARLAYFVSVEAFLAYTGLLIVLYAHVGAAAMRRSWFALGYGVLALPFEWVLDQATVVLRLELCVAAVSLLRAAGYAVAQVGQEVFIDGYAIVLVDACSGLGSSLSLSAVGLPYIFLLRRPSPAYLALCAVAMVAMAIAANLARIVALLLLTHYCGDAVAQGFLHETAGLFMFAIAVAGMIAFDAVAWRLIARPRQTRGYGIA